MLSVQPTRTRLFLLLSHSDLLDKTVALESVVQKKVVMRGVFERDGFDDFAAQHTADDGADGREFGEGERSPRRLQSGRGNAQFREIRGRQGF